MRGNTDAMYNLGLFYDENGERLKAKEWYEKSAAKGDADAMTNLGVLYDNEGEKAKAKEWYEKAASKGSKKAKEILEKMKKNSK